MAFYNGDPAAGGTLIGVTNTTFLLRPGQAQRVHYTWTNPPSGSTVTVYVVADDFGTGSGMVSECGDDSNNTTTIPDVGCP